MDKAAQTNAPDATADVWFATAQTLIAQRAAADLTQDADYEAFGAAIYAKDPKTADIIARKLTASVFVDDPFPVSFYTIMVFAHLNAGDVASAVPWVKRLTGRPAGYLATQDFDAIEPPAEISRWLADQGRHPEALGLNTLALTLTALRVDPHSLDLQRLRLERSNLFALARRTDDAMAQTQQALADNTAYTPANPAMRTTILTELGTLANASNNFADAEIHLSQAVTLLQAHDLTESASAYLMRALSHLHDTDPAVADIWTLQGRIALETGNLPKAKALQRGIAQKFPDYARFATAQAIDFETIAAKLQPDEVMILFATSPDDTSTGDDGSMVLAVTHDALRGHRHRHPVKCRPRIGRVGCPAPCDAGRIR